MAITHEDLSIKKFKYTDISGRLALFLVIFSVLCGLIAFVLCLTAEGSRSELTWKLLSNPGSTNYTCSYSSSGRTPLACAVVAFLLLVIAMFAEHAYMLVAVTVPQPHASSYMLVAVTVPQPHASSVWVDPQDPRQTSIVRDLTWQTCCLFLFTWICFGLAEVLLVIGIGVESGHLRNWTSPRPSCHAICPGVFVVSGVLGLITVFLGIGLYLTASRTQKIHLEEENARARAHPGRITSASISPYPPLPPSMPVVQELDKTSNSA